ncbi:uncharacterized protein BO88DRAFT_190875 [Aspergillus vadensis CBS 113365]|uniref:Uncharacterized protein n=1 Tax=Aspergillus vadensis (strain CBS 113365 / IMI 142717 / IBT 24658) TaxID=1448311 RepID=A0A319AXA1_ASPVC|nr:hypothetical protein BO88DRAFT_190875 [Aspergillus vadensis CBS 113365]PYH64021.1 hypothetical protein BO88DRAFT_190875 [Aspergillus vadensis CBS 113365]
MEFIPREYCIHCTIKVKLTIVHDWQRALTDTDLRSVQASILPVMHDIAPMLVRTTAWHEQTLASLHHDKWIYSERGPKNRRNLFIWERSRAPVIRHGAHGHEGDDTTQAHHSYQGLSPGRLILNRPTTPVRGYLRGDHTTKGRHSCEGAHCCACAFQQLRSGSLVLE